MKLRSRSSGWGVFFPLDGKTPNISKDWLKEECWAAVCRSWDTADTMLCTTILKVQTIKNVHKFFVDDISSIFPCF